MKAVRIVISMGLVSLALGGCTSDSGSSGTGRRDGGDVDGGEPSHGTIDSGSMNPASSGGAHAAGGAGGVGTAGAGGATGGHGASDSGSDAGGAFDPDGDDDGDGLSNGLERKLSLDPESWDTDDDGLTDPDELGDLATPKDTDGDGVIDALESDLTDNDLDGVVDTKDPASGWQVAAGRFVPHVIANDGKSATRVEVVITGAGVTHVALQTPPNYYDATVLPNELAVEGKALGNDALDLFDDGTHGDRFAGDGIWSHGGITTKMASRSATGVRDWVVFVEVLVTTEKGQEQRFLGIPAPNATSNAVVQHSKGFYLGVIDAASVVTPKTIKADVLKTPHLMNIVNPALAVQCKRRFMDQSEGAGAAAASFFRPALDEVTGGTDFVTVFPETSARGELAGEHSGASVDAAGLGLTVQAPAAAWGSNAASLKAGIILDFSLQTPINHEIMHQWAVYLTPSLGLDDGTSHWGVAGTYGVLGGFDPKTFVDNKNGTYSLGFFAPEGNDWSTTPFSPIELYLAGLAATSEVQPIISMQDAMVVSRSTTAVTVKGTKKTVAIDQIVAQVGARAPSSQDAKKAFSMAFAVYSEKPLTGAEMSWFDVYADFYGRKDVSGTMPFYKATSGRATMNTTLPKLAGE